MAIKREDVELGRVDFRDIDSGRRVAPVHPGAILAEEFLEPLGITTYRLAKDIGVPPNRAGAILAGRRAITADTALRLGRYFGMSAAFWMNLQSQYDLHVAAASLGPRLAEEVRPRAA